MLKCELCSRDIPSRQLAIAHHLVPCHKGVNFDYDWSDEVKALLKKVLELFDPNKTKLKKWKNIDTAFTEAYFEASSAHEQLVAAKNQFISHYLEPKDAKDFLIKYKKQNFTAEELLHDMLTEFNPELLKHLKKRSL